MPMPCFDDTTPALSLMVERHPEPGVIEHTMDVALPELHAPLQPWIRVRTNRMTGEITLCAAGRVLDFDDGA